MKIKLYNIQGKSNNQQTTDLLIVICKICLATLHDIYTQFVSIIDK